MNDKRIEDFGTVSTLQDDDLFLVGGSGETFKTTFYDIKSALSKVGRYTRLSATENGVYNPPSNYDAFSVVTVNVDTEPSLQNKTVTQNGTVTADSGYDGLGTVTVNVSGGGGGGGGDIGALIDRTITSIYNSTVSTIGSYAFYYCFSLNTASFQTATTIGSYAFAECRYLTTALFPAVTTIGRYAFNTCWSLSTASFPIATTIDICAFNGCASIMTLSFPAETIKSSAFSNCRSLVMISITASSVCNLTNSNAFGNTALTHICVPESLVSAYKSAPNWSYFSSKITAILD